MPINSIAKTFLDYTITINYNYGQFHYKLYEDRRQFKIISHTGTCNSLNTPIPNFSSVGIIDLSTVAIDTKLPVYQLAGITLLTHLDGIFFGKLFTSNRQNIFLRHHLTLYHTLYYEEFAPNFNYVT